MARSACLRCEWDVQVMRDTRYTPEPQEETPGCGGVLEVISIQVEGIDAQMSEKKLLTPM